MMYVLLLIGFVLLIKGADFFVDGASSIARLLKIPAVIIGLTIVAMGTSAPEAAVSITAALEGNNAIALSNVIGSNIFNILVVAGVCAVMLPYTVEKGILKRDFPINIVFSIIVTVMALMGGISRIGGVILLLCMVFYLYLTIRAAKKGKLEDDGNDTSSNLYKSLMRKMDNFIPSETASGAILSVLFCIVGLAAVILGGQMVVNNASAIASAWGLSDTLIGLTIVALGTSLPELVTSIVASRKGESDLAMGNVVGSNIFNLAFILGMSATVHPFAAPDFAFIDAAIMTITAVLMLILCSGKKHMLNRWEGAFCVLAYIVYTAYIIMR